MVSGDLGLFSSTMIGGRKTNEQEQPDQGSSASTGREETTEKKLDKLASLVKSLVHSQAINEQQINNPIIQPTIKTGFPRPLLNIK